MFGRSIWVENTFPSFSRFVVATATTENAKNEPLVFRGHGELAFKIETYGFRREAVLFFCCSCPTIKASEEIRIVRLRCPRCVGFPHDPFTEIPTVTFRTLSYLMYR